MNVLVIPEDFRRDQYILKPIIKAMMSALGKPRANVVVCTDPLLGGVTEALKTDRIREVLDLNRGMFDLFLLCVDRDGLPSRQAQLDKIERFVRDEYCLPEGRILLAEHAWQELEVWALAGHDLPANYDWAAIRQDPHPKEAYFDPIVTRHQLGDEPGGGRRTLSLEAARRYPRIRQLCPQDCRSA